MEELRAFLLRTGYWVDDRVDEPGEAAIRGEVVDLFPAGAAGPCRIDHADGRVAGIRSYDPATQRTIGEIDLLELHPASEAVTEPGAERPLDIEHHLPGLYGRLESPFELMPEAELVLEPEVPDRLESFLELIRDAYSTRTRLAAGRRSDSGPRPGPEELFLTAEEWEKALQGRTSRQLEQDGAGERPPRFATQRDPGRRFAAFAAECRGQGDRLVLTGPAGPVLRRLSRFAERSLGATPRRVAGWQEVEQAPPGSVLLLAADLAEEFRSDGVVVLTAGGVLGSRAASAGPDPSPFASATAAPAPGEAVIHADHGLARLEGLVRVDGPQGAAETVRLVFRDGDTLMLPTAELSRVWRYGGDADSVSLDRMDGASWAKRRDKVEAEVAEAAAELVRRVQDRLGREAPVLVPPRQAYERFAGRFP